MELGLPICNFFKTFGLILRTKTKNRKTTEEFWGWWTNEIKVVQQCSSAYTHAHNANAKSSYPLEHSISLSAKSLKHCV